MPVSVLNGASANSSTAGRTIKAFAWIGNPVGQGSRNDFLRTYASKMPLFF
jgi:hypothetical protein